ncbi:hypothetical protein PpBr36_00426 [Pyricularia pennisetigena]|uniref:hypothetical protein n=1 Tax=Pyricularia pennisetigena TaxID=1578925 RepID=UPI001153DEA4|nr:hypothetical protein PpBr36_00426 [Pyricularia pennisetigena]TLS28441.1 hypothetical protein PpBr36_00426 [Pyricularia pennisetigena]
MRAKRSKQYRKLMKEYCRVWNFREPYQVLVDADIVKDASRFKMDLVPALERTLHGKVKPMITQCSMRHLYALQGTEPSIKSVIDYAKETFERRRCGHHPDETDALSTLECMSSFITDSGKSARNRYVVASQDDNVRRYMRGIKGVPLIYISRSVMILEPMADSSAAVVAKEERAKFRSGIQSTASTGSKRKRGDDDDGAGGDHSDSDDDDSEGDEDDEERHGRNGSADGTSPAKKKKKNYGPKGPNPLAAKKKKKKPEPESGTKPKEASESASSAQPAKKKRKRRPKKSTAAPAAVPGTSTSAQGAAEAVSGED